MIGWSFPRADLDVHRAVLDELAFDPAVPHEKIGIAVENGVVTLTGTVGTFAQKWAAEAAVKRVRGVRGLADELQVDLMGMHRPSDTDIAESVVNVLAWDSALPKNLQVQVEHGIVTLSGLVDWQYQRRLAEEHAHRVHGVVDIHNEIQLRNSPLPGDVRERIVASLERTAQLDSKAIEIRVVDRKVYLGGRVHSLYEREQAARSAWSIPGVTDVVNSIEIHH